VGSWGTGGRSHRTQQRFGHCFGGNPVLAAADEIGEQGYPALPLPARRRGEGPRQRVVRGMATPVHGLPAAYPGVSPVAVGNGGTGVAIPCCLSSHGANGTAAAGADSISESARPARITAPRQPTGRHRPGEAMTAAGPASRPRAGRRRPAGPRSPAPGPRRWHRRTSTSTMPASTASARPPDGTMEATRSSPGLCSRVRAAGPSGVTGGTWKLRCSTGKSGEMTGPPPGPGRRCHCARRLTPRNGPASHRLPRGCSRGLPPAPRPRRAPRPSLPRRSRPRSARSRRG